MSILSQTQATKQDSILSDSVYIPSPKRVDNKFEGVFYPLQSAELIKLYEAKLIKSAAYVHFALRLENPFCDRPVTIIPKEFALRWRIPEKSVYRAIARLKELGILNIKSGKLIVEWTKPTSNNQAPKAIVTEPIESKSITGYPIDPEPKDQFSELRNPEIKNSQSCEKILRVEKKFSELRKNSQSCENETLQPLQHIDPGIPQTLQNIHTPQTKREEEEKNSPIQISEANDEEVVQVNHKEVIEVNRKDIDQVNRKGIIEVNHQDIPRAVAQKTTNELPNELKEKLLELEIKLTKKVLNAIARHHISQAYGACRHVEETWDTIKDPTAVFLHQLPLQPKEKMGCRHSEEILNSLKAQNEAIERERANPEYYESSKLAFARMREKLKKSSN